MRLTDLFGRSEPADGAVPALEAVATDIGPALLDSAPARRRERAADPGSAVIAEALGQKVLHGWLQNRHQTLVPLTLNLKVLSSEQQATVATTLAAVLLAGRPRPDALEQVTRLRAWLGSLGADPATLAAFDAAMNAPPPLNEAMDRIQAQDLTFTAFVAALMASDPRYPASFLLCDLLQARFDLSTAVVRSAIRRYRR